MRRFYLLLISFIFSGFFQISFATEHPVKSFQEAQKQAIEQLFTQEQLTLTFKNIREAHKIMTTGKLKSYVSPDSLPGSIRSQSITWFVTERVLEVMVPHYRYFDNHGRYNSFSTSDFGFNDLLGAYYVGNRESLLNGSYSRADLIYMICPNPAQLPGQDRNPIAIGEVIQSLPYREFLREIDAIYANVHFFTPYESKEDVSKLFHQIRFNQRASLEDENLQEVITERFTAFLQTVREKLNTLTDTAELVEFASDTYMEFVAIHPFMDGNKRTAMLMANAILKSHKLGPVDPYLTGRGDEFVRKTAFSLRNKAIFREFFKSLIKKQQTDKSLEYKEKGNQKFKQKDYKAAIRLYELALSSFFLDDELVKTLYKNKGKAFYQLKDWQKAIDCFEKSGDQELKKQAEDKREELVQVDTHRNMSQGGVLK